jgi:3-oxoacyl-[acyl-carrier protein] reductase
MDLGLKGKIALVSGASRGLGKAVAATLAAEGARVSLASRDPVVLEAAAREIEASHGAEVDFRPTDVTSEAEIAAWVEGAKERFGCIDILVANAGGPPSTRFESTELSMWRDAIELNLLSTILLCRAVVPHMKERRTGRIVAITSISVKQPVDGLILSNTARSGVTGLMKTLSNELGPFGIGVNVVCPGYTRTDRLVELAAKISEREGISEEAVQARWTSQIPMARLGAPEELAAVVAFICSERASYVTGTAIQVDGGAVKGVF